ncbi:hypothetical protein CNMCM8694_004772 [Aspergillus lentulus]|nr:hypothetical protein CNMCM8060_004937 [Aspergillus lentulus]KAF4188381.1 hypothetical protein CNMCM8694_004772 [Aspergillus lentulus]
MFPLPARHQTLLDRDRLSRRMLSDIRERRQESWGWVVYHTTYKSDPAFCKAIDVINSWIKREVYLDLRYSGVQDPDPTPNDELWACHRLTIMDDSQTLNGATIEDVRSHFQSWVEGQGQKDMWNKYRICMVIDEEILQLLNEVPSAEEHAEMHDLYCTEEIQKCSSLILVRPRVDLLAQDRRGSTALHDAAKRGHLPVVKLLLAEPSIDTNAKDRNGVTPLWWATRGNYKHMAARLLAEPNVDINGVGQFDGPLPDRLTYLHDAVREQSNLIIRSF